MFFKLNLCILAVFTLIISACGGTYNGTPQTEEKQFTKLGDENSDKNVTYSVNLQRPDFSQTPTFNEKAVNSASELANRIQHIRLDLVGENMEQAQLRIKLLDENKQTYFAQFSEKVKPIKGTTYGFHGFTEDRKYEVTALCTNQLCEQSSIVLTEVALQKSVAIRYILRNEFLKSEFLSDLKVDNKDQILLKEAAEYHFPITRHTAKIEGRQTGSDVVDLLIVERPPVDETSEDFSTDYSEIQNSVPVEQNKAPINDVIELESSSEGNIVRSTPPPAPTKAPKTAIPPKKDVVPKKTEQQTQTPPKKTPAAPTNKPSAQKPEEKPQAQLVLTPNAFEVYKINIPVERLKNLTVRNPLQFASFDIVPADKQERYEPAYRMALIANAFVEQKVKIYKNACNFYVRAVMTLAGYTNGRLYKANDFGLIFNTHAQNLNHWKKNAFLYSGNSSAIKVKTENLQSLLDSLPESYATVAQVVRSGAHGHVAIIVKMNGTTYLFDSSLNQHGPRKTVIKASNLLNRSRKNFNLYGIEGLIPAPQFL